MDSEFLPIPFPRLNNKNQVIYNYTHVIPVSEYCANTLLLSFTTNKSPTTEAQNVLALTDRTHGITLKYSKPAL